MRSFTISEALNPKRVFILQKSELEKRWDPNTYHFERRSIIEALKKSGHQLEPLKFVSSFKKNIVKEIPNNIPYLGLENIESNTGSYIPTAEKESISSAIEFKKGQVLFPKLRPYLNKVYFAEFDGVCSTEFHVLDSKKVSNEYLANFLRTSLVVNQTKYLMSGNTLPRLQTEDIESLLIPILSNKDEEKANALMKRAFEQKLKNEVEAEKLLSSIDNYLLKELGITLPIPKTTLKDRIFKSALSKVSGNRLDCDYYLNEEIEIQINNGTYKSVSFSSLLSSLINGYDFRDYKEFGTPYIKVANVRKGNFDFTKMQYIERDTTEISKAIQLKKGNILLTRKGTYGYSLCLEKDFDYVISSEIFYIELKHDKIYSQFLEMFFNSVVGQKQFERVKIGAIMGSLSQEAVKSLRIPLPPLDKQKEIAKHITDIRQQAQQLKDKTKELLKKAGEEIEDILLK